MPAIAATWRMDSSASSRCLRMSSPIGLPDDSDSGFMATILESDSVMYLALTPLAMLAFLG